MSATDRFGVGCCEFDHRFIRPARADKPGAGGFAKREAEFDTRDSVDQCLVDIFDRFNKVRLAEDQVFRVGIG